MIYNNKDTMAFLHAWALDKRFKGVLKVLLFIFCECQKNDGFCYVPKQEIAKKLNMNIYNVFNHIYKLKEMKYVETRKIKDEKKKRIISVIRILKDKEDK